MIELHLNIYIFNEHLTTSWLNGRFHFYSVFILFSSYAIKTETQLKILKSVAFHSEEFLGKWMLGDRNDPHYTFIRGQWFDSFVLAVYFNWVLWSFACSQRNTIQKENWKSPALDFNIRHWPRTAVRMSNKLKTLARATRHSFSRSIYLSLSWATKKNANLKNCTCMFLWGAHVHV